MPGIHRKHTPIMSEAQRGFFGAELARRRAGKSTKTDMSQAELVRHLKESKGKNLPKYAREHKGAIMKKLAERKKKKTKA